MLERASKFFGRETRLNGGFKSCLFGSVLGWVGEGGGLPAEESSTIH